MRSGLEYDDLYQEGFLICFIKRNIFNKQREVKLTTFFTVIVRNHYLNLLHKQQREVSWNRVFPSEVIHPETLLLSPPTFLWEMFGFDVSIEAMQILHLITIHSTNAIYAPSIKALQNLVKEAGYSPLTTSKVIDEILVKTCRDLKGRKGVLHPHKQHKLYQLKQLL